MIMAEMSTRPATVVPLRLLFLLLAAYPCASQGLGFRCSSAPTCQALAGYVVPNDTTYQDIANLFQVDFFYDLYGANSIQAITPASTGVPVNTTLRVPFSCACTGGAGVSDGRPVYKVKDGDTLEVIAQKFFGGLVTYQQIAAANKIVNSSLIQPGNTLWIPLPCSCDGTDGADVVHLAHVVKRGSTVAGIAREFGVAEATLLQLNNMSDPRSLLAGQVLDVPLRACNSSIGSDSPDHSLRIPDGGYALTAGNCVQCSCNFSLSGNLSCQMAPRYYETYLNITMRSGCPRTVCYSAGNFRAEVPLGDLYITGDGCSTYCEYTGYVPVNGLINNVPVVYNQSACSAAAHATRPPPPLRLAQLLLVLLQMVPLFLA